MGVFDFPGEIKHEKLFSRIVYSGFNKAQNTYWYHFHIFRTLPPTSLLQKETLLWKAKLHAILKFYSSLELAGFLCVEAVTNGGPLDLKVLHQSDEFRQHTGLSEVGHCVAAETGKWTQKIEQHPGRMLFSLLLSSTQKHTSHFHCSKDKALQLTSILPVEEKGGQIPYGTVLLHLVNAPASLSETCKISKPFRSLEC